MNEEELNSSKPLGPQEFLPLLLASTSNISGDPLTKKPVSAPKISLDLLPFLHDLEAGFQDDTLADVLSPTLSFFFQEWFRITPAPDIMGDDWRQYVGAIALLVQVKGIAATVRSQNRTS
jgi:ubiquitin conjugation factor E4 B